MKTHLYSEIKETCDYLKSQGIEKPTVGIVLGTGLGSLAGQIKSAITVPFEKCPYFPQATSVSHAGNIIYGTLCGQKILALEGRFHSYEGYTLQQVTYPIRIMQGLGIQSLILSNAAGSLNPNFGLGELMVAEDHINLIGSPLVGPNDDRLGPRFPDMIEPYSKKLTQIALDVARDEKINLCKGVYVAVQGPQLETRAEYRYLRQIGADAVGMSTVPEAIVAVHAGMQTVAISCLTDLCLPDALHPVNIDKIIAIANESEPKLTKIIMGILKKYHD